MRDAYHPDTLEHIPTDTPADWMLRAGLPAPQYNPSTSGCFFRNGAWKIVTSQPDTEALAKDVRLKRNALISQTDWTQLSDAPLTADQKTLWVKYRQDLRDISSPTSNPGFPSEIIWPTKPAFE